MFTKIKRPGASLINVIVFMFAAAMITAQVFFFFNNEMEITAENAELLQVRMRLENLVETAKNYLVSHNFSVNISQDYTTFSKDIEAHSGGTKVPTSMFPADHWENKYHVKIHTLDYPLQGSAFDSTKLTNWRRIPIHDKIFPPMGTNSYLIRAYTTLPVGTSLMHQVLVSKDISVTPAIIKTIAYEEIWY